MMKRFLLMTLGLALLSAPACAASACGEIRAQADRFSRDRAIFDDALARAHAQRIPPAQAAALCMAGANVLADLRALGAVKARQCFEDEAAYKEAMATIPDAAAGTRAIGALHGCRFQ
jgi:hypothetical protein